MPLDIRQMHSVKFGERGAACHFPTLFWQYQLILSVCVLVDCVSQDGLILTKTTPIILMAPAGGTLLASQPSTIVAFL